VSEYVFPHVRTSERAIPDSYRGPVDVWDIDKTYLESEFENWRDLLRGAFERSIDKRARPGVKGILRALRSARPERTPLYFVSASPPELRAVLEGKMLLDGVEWDGISFKGHLQLARARRFREMRRHTAYKLTALLEYRAEWPAGAREWLYGDDAESDAAIYSLYAEIRAGAVGGEALEKELATREVSAQDRRVIVDLAAEAARRAPPPAGGSVEAIYIFRVAKAPPLDLAAFPRVTPVADALALAHDLARRGRIPADAAADVARDFGREAGG
jgi:hypothetical protein